MKLWTMQVLLAISNEVIEGTKEIVPYQYQDLMGTESHCTMRTDV